MLFEQPPRRLHATITDAEADLMTGSPLTLPDINYVDRVVGRLARQFHDGRIFFSLK
jgi:hypothetical protein